MCVCTLQIPSDPKMIMSPYEPERLSKFFLTAVEQQPRRELLLPSDVGVPIRCVVAQGCLSCSQNCVAHKRHAVVCVCITRCLITLTCCEMLRVVWRAVATTA